jgi:hypothetical protein
VGSDEIVEVAPSTRLVLMRDAALDKHVAASDADPFLPLDLEREIFELLAVAHPESIPLLLPVARRVKAW